MKIKSTTARAKSNLSFGDPDDTQNCYKCGCSTVEENWDDDGGEWFKEVLCEHCGSKQGWWYRREYNLEQDKKVNSYKSNILLDFAVNLMKGLK